MGHKRMGKDDDGFKYAMVSEKPEFCIKSDFFYFLMQIELFFKLKMF